MMTQTLIGSVGTEPLHWRGDREDTAAFSVGFTGLLGADAPPTPSEMQALEDFVATIRFQPNPHRTFTDGLPPSVPGFSGNPDERRRALFTNAALDQSSTTCVTCHTMPTGAGAFLVSANNLGESQAINVPQLRDLYKKVGLDFTSQTNNRGFGFGHDGSLDTVFDFLKQSRFTFPAGAAGDAERRDLEAFLMCFPTDTHAAVGTQLTVDGANKGTAAVITELGDMMALADTGVVGLVAKGKVGGVARGYAYVAGSAQLPVRPRGRDRDRHGAPSRGRPPGTSSRSPSSRRRPRPASAPTATPTATAIATSSTRARIRPTRRRCRPPATGTATASPTRSTIARASRTPTRRTPTATGSATSATRARRRRRS